MAYHQKEPSLSVLPEYLHIVGLDIETVPLPVDTFTDGQMRRYELDVARKHERIKGTPDEGMTDEEISNLIRATNPMLGWVCCVSVVRADQEGNRQPGRSFGCASVDEEGAMLREFWEAVDRMERTAADEYAEQIRGKRIYNDPGAIQWVTLNGKDFDIPFLLARTAKYGINIPSSGVRSTYAFSHDPHCDLKMLFGKGIYFRLADLCDHLGISHSKDDMDGSQVAEYIDAGRLEDVIAYCQSDVDRTLDCFFAARGVIPPRGAKW